MVPCEARTATFWVSLPVTASAKAATLKSRTGSSAPLTGAKYRFRYRTVAAVAPIHDSPSWPTTSVVTPCASAPSTRPEASSGPSACAWASMNPGHTTLPAARSITSHSPGGTSICPTAAISGPLDQHVRPPHGGADAVGDQPATEQNARVHRPIPSHQGCWLLTEMTSPVRYEA